MNSQALYRNDSFKINNSNLYTKNQELGIEVTDTLLGIVSLIIRNPSKYKDDGELATLFCTKIIRSLFSSTSYFIIY